MQTRSAAKSMRLSKAKRSSIVKSVKPKSSMPRAGARCLVAKPADNSVSSAAIHCSLHTGSTSISPFSSVEQEFKKTRCYRLNLEGQSNVASTAQPGLTTVEGDFPAPKGLRDFLCNPKALSCSQPKKREKSSVISAANSKVDSCGEYAVSNASIFRGVIATDDETIVCHNPFVKNENEMNDNVHNRGASRQITVINEAVKLVDGFFEKGGVNIGDSSNILSLYIMGEYDDFRDLVQDGPRLLQSGKFLTDEELLSFYHRRNIPHCVTPTNIDHQNTSFQTTDKSSKKRTINSEDWASHSKKFLHCSSASRPLHHTKKLATIVPNEQKLVHRATPPSNRDDICILSPAAVASKVDRGNQNHNSTTTHSSTVTKKRSRSTISTSARPIKRRNVSRNLPKTL